MKLGCNTVLFGKNDLGTVFQQIAWAGYTGAELAAVPGMVEHLRSDGDAGHVAEIRSLANEHGLELYAIEATGNLLEPDARARLLRTLERAHELGIGVVNIGSSGTAGDEDSFGPVLEQINALANRARELGVRLGVKAHVGAALWNGPTLLRALDALRHSAFGVNFDPSHLYRAQEEPAATAQQLAGHIVACHMRDNMGREQKVSTPDQQVPGNGDMDLPAIIKTLNTGAYDGYLTFECIGAGNFPLSHQTALAAQARGYLHRLLREVQAWG